MIVIIELAGRVTGNSTMTALNRKGRVREASYLLVFTGSLLFVLSDSLIMRGLVL